MASCLPWRLANSVLLTADEGMEYQQNLATLPIAILIVLARSTTAYKTWRLRYQPFLLLLPNSRRAHCAKLLPNPFLYGLAMESIGAMALQQCLKFKIFVSSGTGSLVQLDRSKAPHELDVAERFLHRWVGQCVPLLLKVDAQHRLQGYRCATGTALGIQPARSHKRFQGTTCSVSARKTLTACQLFLRIKHKSSNVACLIGFISPSQALVLTYSSTHRLSCPRTWIRDS